MNTTRKRLKLLQDVIKERKILKENLQNYKLSQQGLFEQQSIIQAPTTQAITKASEETQKLTEKIIEKEVMKEPEISILEKLSHNNPYVLSITNELVKSRFGNFPAWRFTASRQTPPTNFILFTISDKEFLMNSSRRDAEPIALTKGLNEIFFNNANDLSKITNEDVRTYEYIIKQAGVSVQSYGQSKFFKRIIKRGGEIITIPSDKDELRGELSLQLAATKAGNNNTFNHANAVMKELLKQKQMSSKEYRNILREYFHI